jgi:hypothetical protein
MRVQLTGPAVQFSPAGTVLSLNRDGDSKNILVQAHYHQEGSL